MERIPQEVLENKRLQKNYIFDYIKENNNIIINRDILVLLQDLGYKWNWDEENKIISNIKKGKFEDISIINIEDIEDETMDIETEITHSYIANGLISHNTINFSENCKKEDISNVFLEAHKRGVVGVTCYRENSRSGILIHNNEIKKDSEIVEHHAPKRPPVLDSDVHRITYKGEKWIAFVGLMKSKPFEIFCGKVDEVNLSKHIEKGKTIKVGSGHYSFSFDDEILIKDINKTFNNEEHDAFARVISSNLRHGTPLQFVCDTLTKSKGDITTFSKVLARILKTYIKDGTNTSLICSNCGEKMRYESGCAVCSCGNSKCG